jgi:hypothetical protein
VSILIGYLFAEENYANFVYVGENTQRLLCSLEYGEFLNTGLIMIMFHGVPQIRRVKEIIDRVAETGIYKYWISLHINNFKLRSRKIARVQPLNGYYSFNLCHMQTSFYLVLIGWCLSALCFFCRGVLQSCIKQMGVKLRMVGLLRNF